MVLYIKNMVSLRCTMKVKEELDKIGIPYVSVELGVAKLATALSPLQQEQFENNLLNCGLELLANKKRILVERIKNVITEMTLATEELRAIRYSDFISHKMNYDYTHLANVFSEVTGTTVQQFIILNKIERVKELLLLNELSIKEITYQLGYSSTAHLSNQFKHVTGVSPGAYKQLTKKYRIGLENL